MPILFVDGCGNIGAENMQGLPIEFIVAHFLHIPTHLWHSQFLKILAPHVGLNILLLAYISMGAIIFIILEVTI